MTTSFFTQLKGDNASTWHAATHHRFVEELFTSSVPSSAMSSYLLQDFRFADAFVALIGAAVATADQYPARRRFGQQLGMICNDEHDYFVRALRAMGVPASELDPESTTTPDKPATKGFKELMHQAAESRSYAAILAVLAVAEGLYLDWAQRAPEPLPENFVYREWIDLHDGPFFIDFVEFLKAELDRVGRSDPEEEKKAAQYFKRAVDLELAFFDAAYDQA